MAKRKTPKAQPLNKTITNEELEQVQGLVKTIRGLQFEIGSIEQQKHSLLHKITETQNKFAELNKDLEKIYGSVDIDINSGEIKEKENVKTNS